MWQLRSRKVLVIAKLMGVVLLAVAVSIAWEAFQTVVVKESDLFSISGRVRFLEREGARLFSSDQVLAWVEDYPSSFFIDTKGKQVSATYFSSQVKPNDTVRVVVQKEELALLYTSSTLRLYGLYLPNGKAVYSYNDAFQRDKKERIWLYVQAGICLLGGLILLFLPKNYRTKE